MTLYLYAALIGWAMFGPVPDCEATGQKIVADYEQITEYICLRIPDGN